MLAVRRFELIFGSLVLALVAPASAAADSTLRSLLLDLNSRPLYVTKPNEDEARVRITSDSGSFSLFPSTQHRSFSRQHWVRRDPAISLASVFDLLMTHRPDGSWIWAHIGKKSPAGMPGVLAVVSPYVRSLVINYDPDEVVSEVSLETYRGSVIYCGRIPNTHYRSSCSLGHVVLHGRETIRFYALIVANRPSRRDALLQEFLSVLASIELHEP
jgi:hypothetical protein